MFIKKFVAIAVSLYLSAKAVSSSITYRHLAKPGGVQRIDIPQPIIDNIIDITPLQIPTNIERNLNVDTFESKFQPQGIRLEPKPDPSNQITPSNAGLDNHNPSEFSLQYVINVVDEPDPMDIDEDLVDVRAVFGASQKQAGA